MRWDQIRHFERSEFGENGDIEPDEDLVRMLNQARELAGIPFIINSGIRSESRNAKIGGTSDSSHISGQGVDIHCESSRHRFLMLDALISVGFVRIGIYPTHIHVDIDADNPVMVVWLDE